jgi:voltage-gated sodium channel
MKLGAAQALVRNRWFEQVSVFMIVLNAVLMGVELNHGSATIQWVQACILGYFVIEIIVRFLGRTSTEGYISDRWNYFDIFIVGISLLPEALFAGADVSVLRTFRIFRIFRLLKHVGELRLITAVLLRSIRSLGYSGILFFVFLYVYAVTGVHVFKQENYAQSVNAALNPSNPDPYGTLGEAMFTLFRIMTGEDWTDLRYNLLSKAGSNPQMDILVTIFHVSWMIISAFLLINLVVGSIVNNYDRMMTEAKEAEMDRDRQESTDESSEQKK